MDFGSLHLFYFTAVHLGKDPLVKKYDTSSLRLFGCGAAPLGREHIEAIDRQLGVGVKQGYVIRVAFKVHRMSNDQHLHS